MKYSLTSWMAIIYLKIELLKKTVQLFKFTFLLKLNEFTGSGCCAHYSALRGMSGAPAPGQPSFHSGCCLKKQKKIKIAVSVVQPNLITLWWFSVTVFYFDYTGGAEFLFLKCLVVLGMVVQPCKPSFPWAEAGGSQGQSCHAIELVQE